MTFLTNDEQIVRGVGRAVKKAIDEAAEKPNPEKLYTIAQTARLLDKSYMSICRMISRQRIKATADGKYISQRAIDNYLTGE